MPHVTLQHKISGSLSIRTALIGFGFSGKTFHAPFLKNSPCFSVTHIVSRRHEDIKSAFSENQPVILGQDELDLVFQNPDIDLAIITTPSSMHYYTAKQALLHGKHVVVEKPFVLDSAHGEELIKIAENKNLVLSVYCNRRWDSDFLTIKSLLNENALGQIFSFKARYDRYRPSPQNHRWKESTQPGAGILWELGPHLIDQAIMLFGTPHTVYADAFPQRPGARAIDYFDIRFTYPNGLRVCLSASTLVFSPCPKYEVHGFHGSFIKYGCDPQEQALINGTSPLDTHFGEENIKDYGTLVQMEEGRKTTRNYPSQRGSYETFFRQLAQSIQGQATPPAKPKEALTTIKLIQLCQESHYRKKELSVS